VLDGGTLGLDLLGYIEEYSRIVIVDAVEAGKEPGTLMRLVNQEILPFWAPRIHRTKLPAAQKCRYIRRNIFLRVSEGGQVEPFRSQGAVMPA
jgi:hydrogenase maturation protease